MSKTSVEYSVSKTHLNHEKNCLWIALYDRRGSPHTHETHYHWAYVLGTKTKLLEREGIRFNIWKSHRLNLIPENKLEHENKIFEPESVRSTHDGCHTNNPFSMFQLAEIKDERALRLHLMAHAIADAEETRQWMCYDWIEAIFYDLMTDKAILFCLGTDGKGQIADFEAVRAECVVPGLHCHESAWSAPEITNHGILPKSVTGVSEIKAEVASREYSTSSTFHTS